MSNHEAMLNRALEKIALLLERIDKLKAGHRAALVEVARRGCNTFAYGTDSVSDADVLRAAEEIVAEYLAEQDRADAAD